MGSTPQRQKSPLMVYHSSMEPMCPQCHTIVRSTDYFCFNCGKNLHQKPLSTTLTTEVLCYAGSIFLPPLGIFWGLKYLKQSDIISKRIGWISIVLTILATLIGSIWIAQFFQTVQGQVDQQLNSLQGF